MMKTKNMMADILRRRACYSKVCFSSNTSEMSSLAAMLTSHVKAPTDHSSSQSSQQYKRNPLNDIQAQDMKKTTAHIKAGLQLDIDIGREKRRPGDVMKAYLTARSEEESTGSL